MGGVAKDILNSKDVPEPVDLNIDSYNLVMEFINLALILISIIGIRYAQYENVATLCAAAILTNTDPN